MRSILLITVPYDSGHRGRRMGAGPLHLLAAGAVTLLEQGGHSVRHAPIELENRFWTEVGAATRLQQLIAEAIASTPDALPLVLSGNCNSSVGTLSGISAKNPAVIWLDAHPDLETPETTQSGFYDGQALASVTGRCWRQMTETVAGFRVVPDDRVMVVGGRDASAAERKLLESSGIAWVREGALTSADPSAPQKLDALRTRTDSVYLHIDLDVHGAEFLRANGYASDGGPSPQAVLKWVELVKERFDLAAVSLTAFDPSCDVDGRATRAALDLIAAYVA